MDGRLTRFKFYSHFSVRLAIFEFLLTQRGRLSKYNLRPIIKWAFNGKIDSINRYLNRNYKDVITKYSTKDNSDAQLVDDFKIWVFWAQGFENAPEIVKMCNRQLLHCNDNVINLSMNNISEWVDIPDYILEQVKTGNITLTHFSDILRFALLSKYGGFWIDSTCWVTDNIKYIADKYNLYTCKKSDCDSNDLFYAAKGRWCGFAIGTNIKNNVCFNFASDILISYNTKESSLIDYFLIDYILNFIYSKSKEVKRQVDAVPIAQLSFLDIQPRLNDKYNDEIYHECLSKGFIFKLSYKNDWIEQTKDGDITFYGKLNEISKEW